MSRIDFPAIASAALAAYPGLLHEWIAGGTVSGHEFQARNPTRSDAKPGSFSINIRTGKWADFAPGDSGGDAIDLYGYLNGLDLGAAAREVASYVGLSDRAERRSPSPRPAKARPPEPEEIAAILPVPDHAPPMMEGDRTCRLFNPKQAGTAREFTSFKPSLVHEYRDANKNLLGYVIRVDMKGGGKITPQITFCRFPDGAERWCVAGFADPRPIYGLDRLAEKPKAIVLLVEGEKSADAGARLYPDAAVIAWPGGTNAIRKVDWTPLQDRRVIVWPDYDAPGYACAAGKINKQGILVPGLAHLLSSIAKTIIISPPKGSAKGWDVADAELDGWTIETARDFMTERVAHAKQRGPLEPRREAPDAPPPGLPDQMDPPPNDDRPPYEPQPLPDTQPIDDEPFRILGYNRGIYYYLPRATAQVVELSPGAHSKLNLLQLANIFYWESRFPKKGGADWEMAANALIGMSHKKGVFRPEEKRRGRGAWIDNGRPVFHFGNVLAAGGEIMDPLEFDSGYTYEGDSPLKFTPGAAATTSEANELVMICRKVRWENKLSGIALAGWCVIAPVCGALNWRPHIWITGPAGSGKTTILRDIIGRVVGPGALQVESKTTEAGLRQALGYDALPVIFDEADAEDEQAQARMQGVLDLARVASSESGGVVYKGSTTGRTLAYRVRSCFCFSSINTTVKHYADETRTTMLVLSRQKGSTDQEREDIRVHYHELMDAINKHLTPEFANRMLIRSVKYLPILTQNADTFAQAAAVVLGKRRIGDQIGAMLAGAYLCHSTKEISFEDAIAWIKRHNFGDHTEASDIEDEERLLQYILEYRLRVHGGNGTAFERSVGELIATVLDSSADDRIASDIAHGELCRNGIRVDRPDLADGTSGRIYISNTSNAVKRILRGTTWASNWRRPLLALDGARSAGNVRFTPALSTRATSLPITIVGI
ncbi:DUF6371 domain-containing protein [Sneathiella sp.]|uniref:DUF6371 domain-containing protein n=1 Tax=Sneathiella sp. TaxID=1964365 RepID=UPI002FE20609